MVNRELIADRLHKVPTLEENHARAVEAVRYSTSYPASFKRQLDCLRPDMPNVVAYYTGGTAAMKYDSEGHLVPTNKIEEVAKIFKLRGIDSDVNLLWLPVLHHPIDSANARWPHWVSVGNAIYKVSSDFEDIPGGINGHIVFGGTDTMAHISAALTYMYPNIGIPIITTGAQRSVNERGDDATSNLNLAVEAAASDLRGIHQAFGNFLREGLHIHKARATNIAMAFDCLDGYRMGEFTASGLILNDRHPKRQKISIDKIKYRPDFREGVNIIKLSPASSSTSILHAALDPQAETLLLLSLGEENVRDEGLYPGELTHVDALEILHEAGYPVVLASSLSMDGVIRGRYAPAAKALEAGVISGRNTTGASLEVKMMRCLALAHKIEGFNIKNFRRLMQTEHASEFSNLR